MGRLIILIIKFLLCLYRTLKESPSSLKQKQNRAKRHTSQHVSTIETILLRFERIVDVQRNVQTIRLTKLYYQQTDGTEKHNKDKTNTV